MSGFDFSFHCSFLDAMAAAEKIQTRGPLPVRAPVQRSSRPATQRAAIKWKVPAVNSSSGLLGLPAVPSIVRSPVQGMAERAAMPSCPLTGGVTGEGAGREEQASPSRFIAATKKSYLEILLSPAAPKKTLACKMLSHSLLCRLLLPLPCPAQAP
jgi:hypothetical protein